MMIRDVLRNQTTGAPVANGVEVNIYLASNDSLLATVTTDSTGTFEYISDENPGPVYYTATIGGTTKKHSTKSVMPVGPVDLSALRFGLAA